MAFRPELHKHPNTPSEITLYRRRNDTTFHPAARGHCMPHDRGTLSLALAKVLGSRPCQGPSSLQLGFAVCFFLELVKKFLMEYLPPMHCLC